MEDVFDSLSEGKRVVRQAKDVSDEAVLRYLALPENQGRWSFYTEEKPGGWKPDGPNPYRAMPEGTPYKVGLAKMAALHRRGLVGGCPCGCRGDFEITDKGLALIGEKRARPYSGY